jgi:hypothetical protein
MESMVSLLSLLVTSVDFLDLTEQDRSALMSTQLLYWCITCNGRPSEIGRMVAHCCRDNEDASTFFVNSLVSIIDNATSTAMKHWFKIYGMVLAVEDELQDERISDGMRDLLRSLNRQRKQYPKSVRAALTQIVQLCSKNAALNNFVEEWRDRADWLDRLFHIMLNTSVNSNITPTSSTSSLTWSKQAATSFSSSFNSPYS